METTKTLSAVTGLITSYVTNTYIEQLNNTITLLVQLSIGIITVYQIIKKPKKQ